MSHQRLVSLSQLTTFHKDSIFQGFDHWIDSKTEFAENKVGQTNLIYKVHNFHKKEAHLIFHLILLTKHVII